MTKPAWIVHYTATDGPLTTHFEIGWHRLCDAVRFARRCAGIRGCGGVWIQGLTKS